MYGDIWEVAPQTWMIEGKMPKNILKEPDIANALVHKTGDTVYVIDTGATLFFRQRIIQAVENLHPFRRLVLLNSHSHPDHTPNNIIIQKIAANEKAHFMPAKSFSDLEFVPSFHQRYGRMGYYYDLLDGPRFPYSLVMRPLKLLRLLGINPFQIILKRSLAKFEPFDVSRETAKPFEDQPAGTLPIKSAVWTGWNLDDRLYVMEAGGHSPDEVVFFLAEPRVLMLADETVPFFNCWPESSSAKVKAVLTKSIKMLEAREASALVDAHTHQLYPRDKAAAYLTSLLADYESFTRIVIDLLAGHPKGLTINRLYSLVCRRGHEPSIRKFLQWEFPHMPGFLKTTITCLLLELGAKTTGPAGAKQFIWAGDDAK